MSAITGLLGLGGGPGGTSANIVNPTNAGQIEGAYTGTEGALAAQNNLLTALQGQNGLGNQSQVYGQLQGVANGTGPNPALAALRQQTGQNVNNQAALAAGQRGAAANPALIARQAAQTGANTQQQAVGQGATLQANQSLNALTAAGNLANTQAGQQIGQVNANQSAQQGEQGQLLGAQQGYNSAQAGIASAQAAAQPNAIGSVANAVGPAAKLIGGLFAEGGSVSGPRSRFGQMLAKGGSVGSRLKAGGAVPGKAKVSGNSYSNDTVKALLSPGEGVIDRETMQDKGPMGQSARALIAAINKKKGRA